MNQMQATLPQVEEYLARKNWRHVPVMAGESFKVSPLAQGEYNLNFLITSGEKRLVFRVNVGTQSEREDQVVYQYHA